MMTGDIDEMLFSGSGYIMYVLYYVAHSIDIEISNCIVVKLLAL